MICKKNTMHPDQFMTGFLVWHTFLNSKFELWSIIYIIFYKSWNYKELNADADRAYKADTSSTDRKWTCLDFSCSVELVFRV